MAPDSPRLLQDEKSVSELQAFLDDRLTTATRIRIVTNECDLLTARTLENLATQPHVHWHVESTAAEQAWNRVISRDGFVTATLGDIALHADLLWFIGDFTADAPCADSRLSLPSSTTRRIETAGPMSLDDLAAIVLATTTSLTADVPTQISEIAEALRASNYSAIVLGGDAFEADHCDAALSQLMQWAWRMNLQHRVVVLRLDSMPTSRTLHRWRTNRSLTCAPSGPEKLDRFAIRLEIVGANETCGVHLGTTDPGPAVAAAFAPVAVPGVHFDSVIVRGDGTVTLPLVKIAEATMPTPAQWLRRLITSR